MREEDVEPRDVQAFSCGDDPWHREVAEFLRSGEAWTRHQSGKSATALYFVDERESSLVGFYNVAKRTVGYPLYHGDRRIPCLLITHIAIASEHQGKRYFTRMLKDIVEAAVASDLEAIYLLVDERNTNAIATYERQGFVPFLDADPYVDPATGASYKRMILPLTAPPTSASALDTTADNSPRSND
jgi:RimJ/RimL family protein N-acetyltransferase